MHMYVCLLNGKVIWTKNWNEHLPLELPSCLFHVFLIFKITFAYIDMFATKQNSIFKDAAPFWNSDMKLT